jgi:predicted outer membrane repeat protein
MAIEIDAISNKRLEIQCALPNSTQLCIIDAKGFSRHFFVQKSTLSLERVVLQNEDSSKDTEYSNGGSFYAGDYTIRLINCQFNSNKAKSVGGAIIIYRSIMTVESKILSVFQNNSASDSGGSIYAVDSTIKIANVEFRNNMAKYGGAIRIYSSNLTIMGSSFRNNTALSGGAIIIFDSRLNVTDFSDLNIRSEFQGNTANGSGGCIYASYSKVDISNGDFKTNTAQDSGGGIIIYGSNLTIYGREAASNIQSIF